jgi:hypothetical protein
VDYVYLLEAGKIVKEGKYEDFDQKILKYDIKQNPNEIIEFDDIEKK